jgi:predicted Holliday junction resolvase-like endonuclease
VDGEHPRDRPIEEQVAVLRHDVEGIKLSIELMAEMQKREMAKTDAMKEQFVTTNEALRLAWKEDFRTLLKEVSEEQRDQRRDDIENAVKKVVGKTQKMAVWLVPFMILFNVFGSWMGWW